VRAASRLVSMLVGLESKRVSTHHTTRRFEPMLVATSPV
jgi:hypothetical protein